MITSWLRRHSQSSPSRSTAATKDHWKQVLCHIDLAKVDQYADTLTKMNAHIDHLPEIERQVGGESLRGRTGGAVTLAVGMAQILSHAMDRVTGGSVRLDAVIKYWYHFAIMFEALFILTTIDTGTRIACFLLHEALGKLYRPLDFVDWLPGAVLCTGLVTATWGGLIWTGSIETIWPMSGIANQLLASIALCVVTTLLITGGKAHYAPLTLLPMLFVGTTTLIAANQMVSGRFWETLVVGTEGSDWSMIIQGGVNIGGTVFLVGCFVLILATAVCRWLEPIWQRIGQRPRQWSVHALQLWASHRRALGPKEGSSFDIFGLSVTVVFPPNAWRESVQSG